MTKRSNFNFVCFRSGLKQWNPCNIHEYYHSQRNDKKNQKKRNPTCTKM